jgi:hypothetical protein
MSILCSLTNAVNQQFLQLIISEICYIAISENCYIVNF